MEAYVELAPGLMVEVSMKGLSLDGGLKSGWRIEARMEDLIQDRGLDPG